MSEKNEFTEIQINQIFSSLGMSGDLYKKNEYLISEVISAAKYVTT